MGKDQVKARYLVIGDFPALESSFVNEIKAARAQDPFSPPFNPHVIKTPWASPSFSGRNVTDEEVTSDITMPAISLLMESVRLQDELPLLKERVPDPARVYRQKAPQLKWDDLESLELAVAVWAWRKKGASVNDLHRELPRCSFAIYKTVVGVLQAGLEGIEKGYELPEPMEQNLYHLAADERRRLGIEQLPETLGEAIELAAGSELVLRALGEHTFNRYIEIKRQEWEDYRVQVTQWELDRYLPLL